MTTDRSAISHLGRTLLVWALPCFYFALGCALAQPTLQITAPPDKTVLAPGQTLTVTVMPSVTGVFSTITVVGEQPIGFYGMQVLTAPPWQFAIQLPTTIAPGLYVITAVGAYSGGQPVQSDPIEVNVERPDDPVSLHCEARHIALPVGKTVPILLSGVYSDGLKYYLTESTKTTYTSNNPPVAVVDTTGLITAVAPGLATIRVANGATATFVSVTVLDPLGVVPRAKRLYQMQKVQFTAVAGYSGPAQTVNWSTDPPGVGTLDNTGLYTAPATIDSQQNVTIIADTADGTAEAVARVTLYPPISVAVAPAAVNMFSSQAQQFTATVNNAVDTWVDWSSDPDGVGAIDITGRYVAPDVVTGAQAVTITATSAADPSKSATASITINPLPAPTLTSITPAVGARGATVHVTLKGVNFALNSIVAVDNPGITVNNLVPNGSTQMTADFDIAVDAAFGAANVTVTTSSGTSGAVTFTVSLPACPPSTTLQTLINLGYTGCQWGGTLFFGFLYEYDVYHSDGTSTFNGVPASAVTVQFSNSANDPLNPVISFLGNWSVINGDIGNISALYNLRAVSAAAIISSSVSATGQASNVDPNAQDSFLSVAETISPSGNTLGITLEPSSVTTGPVTVTGSDSTNYAATTYLTVTQGILLYSTPPGIPPAVPQGNWASVSRWDNGLRLQQ